MNDEQTHLKVEIPVEDETPFVPEQSRTAVDAIKSQAARCHYIYSEEVITITRRKMVVLQIRTDLSSYGYYTRQEDVEIRDSRTKNPQAHPVYNLSVQQ